ncbi:MAG: gliding motility-associated C-terminal domain-containing protein [Sphingobacteriales bacterium]
MFYKRILLSFFITALTFKAFSAVFVVTSNADSGPGTLREALNNAAANGTTVQDTIRFNLPGSLISDRTIRLKTQLPFVTSNLVIDGTTQPGIPFGVSDARVIIEPETSPAYFSCLYINGDTNFGGKTAQKIEIYGLYIRNFAKITNLAIYDSNQGSGILLQGSVSNITIGAPGKGNVICGNIYGIYNSNNYYYTITTTGILVQNNFIGVADDGVTPASNIFGINVFLNGDLTIGGKDATFGNVIAGNVTNIGVQTGYYYTVTPNTVSIQNNKIGTDYTGAISYRQSPLFQQSAFLVTYGINISSGNTTASILNNVISGQSYYGIYVENAAFLIKGNKIGTDITGTKNLGNGEGIKAGVASSGTIGGPNAAGKNYIAYNTYGIEALNDTHALITQNSIFCNTNYGISVNTYSYQVPFVQVLNFSSTAVSGVATPNSQIELFYSDDCPNICQGKTYITTVAADANGKWIYNGSITQAVIATATDANKNTSPFSSLIIQNNDLVIKQYTCAYNGSITLSQTRSGFLFHWDKIEQNGTLTPVGDTQNIANLLPGNYRLTVQYPGGCQKVTQLFEITDQRIKIQNIISPVPVCRQKQFQFDVNYTGGTGNVQFTWKDANGNTIAGGKSPVMPEGTYTLTISDDAGCKVTSAPVTIKAKPGPDYDLSTMQVNPARCGIADGSIKNITTYVGIGTLSYSWQDATGKQISTKLDLTNVPGGSYTLTLSDQSQCSPYSTPPIFISETNSVIISDAFITQPKCGNNDGSITGISTQNADSFQWYDPSGAPITTNQSNLDLFNLAEGTYRLHAVNTVTNCSNDKYFTVTRLAPDVFTVQNTVVTPATCHLNNGSVHLTFSGKIIPQTYQWTDAAGTVASYVADLTNAAPGSYTLNVTDSHGCPSVLGGPYVILNTPLLQFAPSSNPVSTADVCDQQFGSIKGVAITGGVEPYNITWTVNPGGKIVGNNLDLTGVGQGSYHLHITDNTTCAIPLDTNYTVGNNEIIPAQPSLADHTVCSPGIVPINVISPKTGVYNLYNQITDIVPAYTNTSGRFSIQVDQTSDYYVSYNVGSCESPRTKVHIEVVLIDVKFPTAFTPNGDGINDYWDITGIEKYPATTVQVFNRSGQRVFESKGYAHPFDGTYNGKKLPADVYYFIINLATSCDLFSGSLTLIR